MLDHKELTTEIKKEGLEYVNQAIGKIAKVCPEFNEKTIKILKAIAYNGFIEGSITTINIFKKELKNE
jgi:hypothetical protein